MPIRGLAIAIVAMVIDQIAKWGVLDYFLAHPETARRLTVTPFFNVVLTLNRGISFGVFNNPATGEIVLVALAVAIMIALFVWLRRVTSGFLAVALGLIIGGAAGNALDRVVRGAVVDFLDFHLGQWHPFAFNLADAAISVGVALLILDGLFGGRGRAAR